MQKKQIFLLFFIIYTFIACKQNNQQVYESYIDSTFVLKSATICNIDDNEFRNANPTIIFNLRIDNNNTDTLAFFVKNLKQYSNLGGFYASYSREGVSEKIELVDFWLENPVTINPHSSKTIMLTTYYPDSIDFNISNIKNFTSNLKVMYIPKPALIKQNFSKKFPFKLLNKKVAVRSSKFILFE